MGKIYAALKKAQREAQHLKEKGAAPGGASQGEMPGISFSAFPEIKNTLLDDKSVSQTENDFQLPQRTDSDRYSFEKIKEELFAFHQPHSILSEELRKLCTRLNFNSTTSMRSILVTSSVAAEGKSTVSANLAISIAQGSDKQVLLIDADLRKPSLHELFALKSNDGLGGFLKSGKNISELIQKTDLPNLSVLPGRVSPDHPAMLMASEKMPRLIEEMTSRYKDLIIIFDSTPVQQTAEPSILAKQVDGILLVVRAGMTNRDLVKNTLDTLGREKVLGIIFNHSNEHIKHRYQYYYQPHKKEE